MRVKLVLKFLGKILVLVGICMLVPLLCSIYYHSNDILPILLSSVITVAAGFILYFVCYNTKKEDTMRQKEGFLIVALGWIFVSLFGALPFVFAGVAPNYIDAFFETMSGFTTTGATIFKDIQALPQGILFWRSMTQWLGGLGIAVIFVALFGSAGSSDAQMYKAEIPGMIKDRFTPRIGESARILFIIYLIFTALVTVLLMLGGMSLFDAMCHTFSALSTGGFSTKNASIAAFDSAYIQWVIIFAMFFAAINLSYFYMLFVKKRNLLKINSEIKAYAALVLVASVAVFVILLHSGQSGVGVGETFRQAVFQVISVITTTGFITANYDKWPVLASGIILLLMFAGGCTGSTSGSVKIGRWVIIARNTKMELTRLVHPKVVTNVKLNGKNLSPGLISNVLQFFCIYIAIFFLGTFIMMGLGLPTIEAWTSVASSLANFGPASGFLGPIFNYADLSGAAKLILSTLMFVGRLELYTVLVLFMPSNWRRV